MLVWYEKIKTIFDASATELYNWFLGLFLLLITKIMQMKTLTQVAIAMSIMVLGVEVDASDYSDYYQNLPIDIAQVEMPQIPQNEVSIVDFGAKGDGVTLCTDAFAQAIEKQSSNGGGVVVVPNGMWLTGPIELKSNVELRIAKNAVVFFSPDKLLYERKKSSRCKPCISASKQKNIAITGSGTIDGNGSQWRPVKRSKVSDVEGKSYGKMGGKVMDNGSLWYPWDLKSGYANIGNSPKEMSQMRNDLIRFENCENILVQGVIVQNSPRFHVHPVWCKNFIADGLTVRCPWNAQNGDGIDISDVSTALIVNCTVDVGDDGICMKSDINDVPRLNMGTRDVLIQDCVVNHAHGGFVIGSEDVTAMERIVVRDCRFSGTDTGLRFKSGIGRGGRTNNIFISNIVMTDISDEAIIFQCDYINLPAGMKREDYVVPKDAKYIPEFQDIHIDGVICRGCETAISASGIEGYKCVHDIDIKNSTIVYTKKSEIIDAATAELKLTNVNLIFDRK